MTITNRDDLLAALAGQKVYSWWKNVPTSPAVSTNYTLLSLWRQAGQSGAALATPNTATVCTAATPGALMRVPALTTGTTWYLANMTAARRATHDFPLIVFDRLAHRSGFSALAPGAQTAGLTLPTRITDKTMVQIFIEINTAIGATPRPVTVSYTNEAGTAGRSATLPNNGNLPANAGVGLLFGPLDLQAGDLGVTSVESLTMASTGSAGDMSVLLLRPLWTFGLCRSGSTGSPGSADQATVPGAGLVDLGADPCLMLANMGCGASPAEERGEVAICQG